MIKASDFVVRAGSTVVTGAVGAVAYQALRRATRRVSGHEIAVRGATWGLKGARSAEWGAETARLRSADILAEARQRMGEQAPPPGPASHDHDH